MRVFVWEEFSPDYYDGLAVAIAETEEQAKELVISSHGSNPLQWGPVQVFEVSALAFSVPGGA